MCAARRPLNDLVEVGPPAEPLARGSFPPQTLFAGEILAKAPVTSPITSSKTVAAFARSMTVSSASVWGGIPRANRQFGVEADGPVYGYFPVGGTTRRLGGDGHVDERRRTVGEADKLCRGLMAESCARPGIEHNCPQLSVPANRPGKGGVDASVDLPPPALS